MPSASKSQRPVQAQVLVDALHRTELRACGQLAAVRSGLFDEVLLDRIHGLLPFLRSSHRRGASSWLSVTGVDLAGSVGTLSASAGVCKDFRFAPHRG